MTEFEDVAIIINVVTTATTKTILENDTAKSRSRRKNSQISERVNAWNIREALRALASPRRGRVGQVRIEHQSLILAQDERWRRA